MKWCAVQRSTGEKSEDKSERRIEQREREEEDALTEEERRKLRRLPIEDGSEDAARNKESLLLELSAV